MKRQDTLSSATIADDPRKGAENKRYDNAMLLGLQQMAHIYAGTVPHEVKLDRRRRNKVRRLTRQQQRRAAGNK